MLAVKNAQILTRTGVLFFGKTPPNPQKFLTDEIYQQNTPYPIIGFYPLKGEKPFIIGLVYMAKMAFRMVSFPF